jgi:hypothetical protein
MNISRETPAGFAAAYLTRRPWNDPPAAPVESFFTGLLHGLLPARVDEGDLFSVRGLELVEHGGQHCQAS